MGQLHQPWESTEANLHSANGNISLMCCLKLPLVDSTRSSDLAIAAVQLDLAVNRFNDASSTSLVKRDMQYCSG